MDTQQIKEELDKTFEKLVTLRDEVKVQLHLASLDAKQEWDEKLAPRVLEAEQAARNISESSRGAMKEVVARLEDFLDRLRGAPPHSKN